MRREIESAIERRISVRLRCTSVSCGSDYIAREFFVPGDRHGLIRENSHIKRQERTAHNRRTDNTVADRVQLKREKLAS
jgi:hypothetical protein